MPLPARRLIIGDVHGHYQALKQLIDLLDLRPEDQVYFLGDLIDRGPDSAQVIAFVKEHGYHCVLGNHEHLMLMAFPDGTAEHAALQSWLYCGGQPTVSSYKFTDDLYTDLDWLRTLPLYIDLGDLWLVHAGLDPNLPVDQQSEQEFCWIRGDFHSSQQPYFTDKLILTGHTITFTFKGVSPGQLAQGPGWLNIETGAYHQKSGWLTALDPDLQQVYQVNTLSGKTRVRSLAESVTLIDPTRARN